MDSLDPTEGRLPAAIAAVALVVGAIVALLVVGSLMARCSMPAESPPNDAMEQPNGTQSTAQATATASQAVRVTITRKPASQDAPQATRRGEPGGLGLSGGDGGSTAPTDGESITIEVSQAVGVAAGASASVSAPTFGNLPKVDHARLGLVAITAPGILAADYQLLRLDASPLSRPALGVDLELGLDVAGNAQVGALGVTAGGKAFSGAWAWSRWDLGEQGVAMGVGLRF
jgi:hypothetical protein